MMTGELSLFTLIVLLGKM